MTKMPPIKERQASQLRPYERNARTHSDEQLQQIAASIEEFGFTNPVLIDDKDRIIAGHGRVRAAELLGLEKVPCLRIDWLTEAQRRAYIIADNKIADNAGWDRTLLRLELGELADEIDLSLTGFGGDELEKLFDDGEVSVEDIPASQVEDRFWISIRGPLRDQASALQRLQEFMAVFPEVDVDLGTVSVDL